MRQTMLRERWGSDAIIQTDCCDSVQTISGMKYRVGGVEGVVMVVMMVEEGWWW